MWNRLSDENLTHLMRNAIEIIIYNNDNNLWHLMARGLANWGGVARRKHQLQYFAIMQPQLAL